MVTSLKEAQTQLAAEIKEVLPGLSDVDAEKQLKLLLGHAYNRIQLLQKQILEKQKALEEIRARGSHETGTGGVSESVLQAELDKLRHQLQLQHR
ncbi:hypothetical protein FHG87_019188 [Trinorchestia longiramus]|nr:hypothetical protein FHG87_019188 [Trinorchestia longiramus]